MKTEPAAAIPPGATQKDSFTRFAWTVLAYNVLVVLWGAYVRATGSGAGCGGHWPLCNGDVVPRSPTAATLIEYTHRLSSGLALVAVGVLWAWSFRRFPRGHRVRLTATLSVVFLCVEALLGAGLVLFNYVAQNVSLGRAMYLSAHLVNTQILLAMLAATAWLAGKPGDWPVRRRRPRVLAVALAATLVVSVAGAIAALGDTLFPASSVAAGMRQEFSATASLLIRLRWIHPALAVVAAVYLLFVATRALRWKPGAARTAALLLAVLVFAQVSAGALDVTLLAPVWMQIVHLLLADLLWITLVVLFVEGERALAPA